MTIDDIYEEVDQLARAGRFNQIDQRLCGVDVPEVEAVELLAWLTATVPCKTKLESRGAFFENACRSFCVRFGGVGELLAGLE